MTITPTLSLDTSTFEPWDLSGVTDPQVFKDCRFYKPTIRQRLFWAKFRVRKAMKGAVRKLCGKRR